MLVRLFSTLIGRIFFSSILLCPALLSAQEPSTQGSSLTVSNLGSGTLTLSWTGGDGANTIILAKSGSAVDSDPVDNTSYTADQFGSGTQIGVGNFVVFSGSANTALIQGLSANTTYHFAIYEFNTGGAPNDPDYLTTGPATVSTTTSTALMLYSYQNGNAETASTWTTDASGLLQQNSAVPGAADDVTILVNRTVTVTTNNFDVSSMTVDTGGVLALGTTTGHDYATLTGTGLIQSGSAHPTVTSNDFATTSGGTFEYLNTGALTITSADQTTYNNLTIDNSNVTVGLNLTVNGALTLENSSTLTLGNDATARTLAFDDITVGVGSSIATGTTIPASNHTATITGSITNNGTINFTNQTAAEYTVDPTSAVVEVTFSGATNETMSCSGETDFFNLVLDKGSSQTNSLSVTSTSTSNFRIFGRNNEANTSSGDDANPNINKALWIKNGTLQLGSNISIPSLTEGGSDYMIPENGALFIDGADVTTTTTDNGNSNQSLFLVGQLRIDSGSLEGSTGGGIYYGGNSELDINGGTIGISQLRSSSTIIGTENSIAYDQSAGDVTVDNRGLNVSLNARFDIGDTGSDSRHTFSMSGGTLTVSFPSSFAGGINIGTSQNDISVTGGTVILEVTGGSSFGISSNGPFFNLTLQEDLDGATGSFRTINNGNIIPTELTVLNDLLLTNDAELDQSSDPDDVAVGGNFTIETGSTYTPGDNATIFNGSGTQTLTVNGTISGNLHSLTMNKSAGTLNITSGLTLDGDLNLTSGTLADGGNTISVSGNVTNSATHSGSGAISLVGTALQTISGDGTGVFQNLTLFNTNAATAPVSTSAAITINGTLTFSNDKLLSVGANLLTLGSAASISGSSSARYIQTSGNSDDGGVSKVYSAAESFTWPIGSASGSVYTPAIINVGTATTAGTINIIPVASEHPNVTAAGTSLTYYWDVSSTGFTGISNITHTYEYKSSDVVGDEADYISARFNTSNSTWTTGAVADVDESNPADGGTIGGAGTALAGVVFIDGDFTAGDSDPTNPFGAVTIFYSRNDAPNITTTGADWDTDDAGNKTTWSTTSHSGSAATQLPEDVTGARVIIASGHIVDVSSNTKSVSGLELSGTVDLGTTTGHDFGNITSNGTMRISSAAATAVFPTGDASDFTGTSGGTVVYYKSGTQDFTLPSGQTTYRNLSFETGTGSSSAVIDFPDADIAIGNDLTVSDGSGSTQTGTVGIAENNNFTVGNDITVTSVNGNATTLTFRTLGSSRAISVGNDVTVGAGTTFHITNGNPQSHTLSIGGSIVNNGTMDFDPAAGNSVELIFTGSANESITGTGATTQIGDLTINKGTSLSSELNVNATDFEITSLTLTNGTFRLTSAQTVTASTTTFTIPSTTRLAASGGTINIGTGASDNNDLSLIGELEITDGTINIGTDGNDNNNDIEYVAVGSPTIDIQGGTLNVNGQIRRGVSNAAGNLIYSQSAGTVTIRGRNQNATRAKLEVTNSGSFTMSNGTINIIRGGGTTFDDVYIAPASASVTGGTLVFAPGTSGNQTYNLSSTTALSNLTVTGNGGSNTASLTINDQAVSLADLTISEANSTFNANSLDVSISGDFSNTGTYTAGSNTTTFNGSGTQGATINAATTFGTLAVNKSGGTLTLSGSSDISVNSDFNLESGTMEDGGRTITVTGNISNNGTHTSGTIGTGGLSLSDADHTISGTGTFGNLTLNGTTRTVTVGGAITLNADLDFTGTVVFDIDQNNLTFGSSATITGSSFGSTKMIRTASNNAITKNFPASATDFTFPIGISTNYTPARTNLTANSATGSITVETVDERHPLTSSASDTELLRYWDLTTSGLSGTATLVFTYVSADVQGTETSYFGGKAVGGDWSPVNGTEFDDAPTNTIRTVDDSNNTITYSSIGTADIAGGYTAGETAEFASSATYFSRATGDWETAGTWSTESHVGAAASSPPNGHNVDIDAAHTVTVTSNSASSFSLILDGTLALGSTVSHSFGEITGSGTMTLSATGAGNFTFPSSDISGFTGTHNFGGATDGNMINTPSAFSGLTFSGTSVKNLENTSFTINGTFSMSAGTVNHTETSTLSMGGDFSNTGATFTATAGTFDFSGTGAQAITASGGSTTFNNLTLSNTSGTITLNDNISVNGTLTQAANTTFDVNANTISGTGSVAVSGEVQTSNTNGLSGAANTSFGSTLSSVTLNTGSNINYDATGAQTVSARTDYDGLQVSGSGTKTLGGAATVGGALNVGAGDLSIGANTLTMNGTVTGAGTITGSTTSNISIGGTGDLGTIDFSSGGETVGDLTINRTSSGTVTFEESFTIDNAATFTAGQVNLAEGSTITMGSSGDPAAVTTGDIDHYFNTDPVDDDLDTNPEISAHINSSDLEIPLGFNPGTFLRISCPSCTTQRFGYRVSRGPYNTPPRSGGRETNNVVQAQWAIREFTGTLPVSITVRLCWANSLEGTGLGTDVGISIYDTNLGSPFWDIGSSISAKSTFGSYSCQSRTFNVTGTNRIYLAVANDQSPLPITLLSFGGEMNVRGGVDLAWETIDEVNNDFFVVQRSANGLENWEDLGVVQGAGTSTSISRYNFTDDNPNKDFGRVYYRLKQVDFNGLSDYSPVIGVQVDNSLIEEPEQNWKVYPNPSHGYDLEMVLTNPKLKASDLFQFRLSNGAGQLLYDSEATGAMGSASIKDALTFAASGIYFLEIATADKVERHRLIKK